MLAYAAIPLTCWLCTLLAAPRRPRTGDEMQELVYSRLLGRHQCLILIAIVASMVALFVLIVGLPGIALSVSDTRSITDSPAGGTTVCEGAGSQYVCDAGRPYGG